MDHQVPWRAGNGRGLSPLHVSSTHFRSRGYQSRHQIEWDQASPDSLGSSFAVEHIMNAQMRGFPPQRWCSTLSNLKVHSSEWPKMRLQSSSSRESARSTDDLKGLTNDTFTISLCDNAHFWFNDPDGNMQGIRIYPEASGVFPTASHLLAYGRLLQLHW